jgi:hypothetical protein
MNMRDAVKELEISVVLALLGIQAAAATPSPRFVRTQNSDEWVTKTFHLQQRYSRVLLVGSGTDINELRVASLDLNHPLSETTLRSYPIHQRFANLQEAADAAHGGDLIAVLPGHYAGFVLGDKNDATDKRYIHFKAMGPPGSVVIDQASRVPEWMVLLEAAHHVVLDGFNIAGASGPDFEPKGPRAGIMLDGNFGHSGKQVHHVAVIRVFSHNHRTWGLHSTDTHTVLIEDSVFALSCLEHSAYVSDGSDNYVIRRNIFFGSYGSGLQINIDPESSLHEVLKHPRLKDFPPEQPTREWAQKLLNFANHEFGENNFPDGRGINFIVEENIINGNGKHGGGSLNLAGLQDSLIQNNLIYGNFSHGMALWDDANRYDSSAVLPGPSSPEEASNPAALSLWGCQRNLIRNNTVLMNAKGRAALLLNNGSWGNVVRNNILINDQPNSLEVTSTSIYRLDSGFNVLNTIHYIGVSAHSRSWKIEPGSKSATSPFSDTDMPSSLKPIALNLDEANHSRTGFDRETIAKEFLKYNEEPWILIEDNMWRLNPARPNFHPRPGSTLLSENVDQKELPRRNVAGEQRQAPHIGAY